MPSSLDPIFKPRTIAVIGASAKQATIGNVIVRNILRFGFKGKLFPVNPKAEQVESLKCYPSVLELSDPADLAVIVVPRDFVAPALDECGQRGVKGVVVITSGFKEIGGEGIDEENDLLGILKKYDMRMVGPNCYGVVNTDPAVSLNCTFSKLNPLRGKVAFMSQSGALGEVVIDYTNSLNLGLSMFASVGNKADVSDNDVLEYWKDDPNTEMILLYLENIDPAKGGKRFTELAKDIVRTKPVFAVKAGRTAAGAKAISSHTGVLAGGDAPTDAVLRQCGIIRVGTIDELFDAAQAFANQPVLKGDRIAVITNAGGPGILATDAVESLGLHMARFEKKTIDFLRLNLPLVAAVTNPIDVIASGGADAYGAAVQAALSDANVDGLIVIFVPPILVNSTSIIRAVVERVERFAGRKTVLACLMGSPGGIPGAQQLKEKNVPTYLFPESAARALWAMDQYRKVRARPTGRAVTFEVNKKKVETIVANAQRANMRSILGCEALEILEAYGIRVAPARKVLTEDELMDTLGRMKLPVVLKVDDPAIVHKTEVGGVVTNLKTKDEVLAEFAGMNERFGRGVGLPGVLVQEMVTDGIEIILGMNRDPSLGPVLMFGLGGIFVEVLKDVAFGICPLVDADAADMIRSVKGFPLLTGFRGRPPADIELLEETLLRLSQLIADFPVFSSLDINPYIIGQDSSVSMAVDARVMLAEQ